MLKLYRKFPKSGSAIDCHDLTSQATLSFINTMPKNTTRNVSLVAFRDALSDLEEPPFCTGLASLDANNSILFYRAGNSPFAKYVVVFRST